LAEKQERISWRGFFDGLDELKRPAIGRPVTRADIKAAVDKEFDAAPQRRDADDRP
jgi:hypothetical protein